jgi:hypothetical protein
LFLSVHLYEVGISVKSFDPAAIKFKGSTTLLTESQKYASCGEGAVHRRRDILRKFWDLIRVDAGEEPRSKSDKKSQKPCGNVNSEFPVPVVFRSTKVCNPLLDRLF